MAGNRRYQAGQIVAAASCRRLQTLGGRMPPLRPPRECGYTRKEADGLLGLFFPPIPPNVCTHSSFPGFQRKDA